MILKAVKVCLILAFLQVVACNPKNQNNYLEQESSCKDVCSLCECEGFYCEDECICECDIEEKENLQCIADMKTECDKNGLEYEILLQDSAKERFLRQVSSYQNPFSDLKKNFVIMKQKREPSPTPEPQSSDPIVGASNPASVQSVDGNADPIVGAANPNPEADESSPLLGMPVMAGKMAAGATRAAIMGTGAKLAFGGFAAKSAIAGKTAKAAVATTAAKTSLAGGLALAGLGTKMKANKMLFSLGAPRQADPPAPSPPAAPAVPSWLNWGQPVLGAAKPTTVPTPPANNPEPSPSTPASSRSKFFTFGPVQPAHLIED